MPTITPAQLYQRLTPYVALHRLTGDDTRMAVGITLPTAADEAMPIGQFNPIRHFPITLLEQTDLDYIIAQSAGEPMAWLQHGTRGLGAVTLITGNANVPAALIDGFQAQQQVCFSTPAATQPTLRALDHALTHHLADTTHLHGVFLDLIDGFQAQQQVCFSTPAATQPTLRALDHALTHHLADTTHLHGVFLDVMGAGVLITGQPGIGKSELALDLLSRGHRLIIDDAPEFQRTEPDTVTGSGPDTLRNFMEVRGLGVLNVRALFGDAALKQRQNLRLIVNLTQRLTPVTNPQERLTGRRAIRRILGVSIPEITLPVAAGHNLAVLTETAVRNHLLIRKGYDAHRHFETLQAQIIAETTA